ncbi:hypothetical protein VTK73DRAFT_4348 [Phialemonium thermophilum]|uniref:Glucosylceramidase n=1 Tax=Phialemonium thermophilum TaxID=223376 RepID=A0ABR3V9Z0_9PEZI
MTADGVNFSLLRHTVGASDLSGDPAYTYDDNGGNADPSFAGFNLGDRGNAMAALLRDMKALRPDATILGTPWGPPAWMQVDRKLVGSTTNNQLDHAYAAQFGQYFVKYLQAYQKAGVRIDAITIQNEPLNNNGGMPSLVIQADESAGLIHDNVGPALRGAGFDTQIWAWDHNTDVASYPQTVLNGASQYVSAVAWHCYANPLNWTVLTAFHQANPGVAQYMTECWTSPSTPWNQAAGFTMGPLQNWASGAIAWTLGTDTNYGPHLSGAGACTTCRGLVTVDAGRGTYSFQVDYYMLGQFSKFIPKGATVLSGSGSWTYADGTGLESVATVNPDGSRTVVIENKFGNDIYVTLTTKSGQTWSGRVYKNSVVTWLLPAA